MIDRSDTEPGGPFGHPALFYRDDGECLRGTVPFVRAGLEAGEPVAVAVPGPRLDAVRACLGAAAAEVEWIDMAVAGRNPGRIIPGVLCAFADRHRTARVRIIGEPVWAGRTPVEYPACVQHEALINLAFANRRAAVLCPYDVSALDARVIADACATHPTVIDRDGERRSPHYAPRTALERYNRPLPAPPPGTAPEEFRYDIGSLPRLREFAYTRGAALGLDDRRAGDLELAINELGANSIVHAGGKGVLRIWPEDGHVVGEVRDDGRFTDPLAGRLPAGLSTDGGRGLLMVNHLADLVRLHTTPEGTAIRVYMRL
ncbi:sensor histidine kinase [Actinomadura keratinilytica]|uniref:Anti-sigma factor RsbA family regulatory protein n=1 Tax=Actinomadura keratinilytica TaxID=547461 RepID=A0ABP7ZG79_9ACTN